MRAGELIPKVRCKWTEDIPDEVPDDAQEKHRESGKFCWKYNDPQNRKSDKRGFVFFSVRVFSIRKSRQSERIVMDKPVTTVFGIRGQKDLAIRVAEKITCDLEEGRPQSELPRRIDLFNRRR